MPISEGRCVHPQGQPEATLKLPSAHGAYRAYVWVRDRSNHYASANVPFYVVASCPVSQDTYTRDGGHAFMNYGTSSTIDLKTTAISDYRREGYLRFTGCADFALRPAFVSAVRLKLYAPKQSEYTLVALELCESTTPCRLSFPPHSTARTVPFLKESFVCADGLEDVMWKESRLAADSLPFNSTGVLVATASVRQTEWVSFDVTAFVLGKYRAGPLHGLSFRLRAVVRTLCPSSPHAGRAFLSGAPQHTTTHRKSPRVGYFRARPTRSSSSAHGRATATSVRSLYSSTTWQRSSSPLSRRSSRPAVMVGASSWLFVGLLAFGVLLSKPVDTNYCCPTLLL